MQLNKIIIILVLISFNLVHGQPSATQKNHVRIKILIKDNENQLLNFSTKDSLFFFTDNKEYLLSFASSRINYKYYLDSHSMKRSIDSVLEKSPIYLGQSVKNYINDIHDKSYGYSYKDNSKSDRSYDFIMEDNNNFELLYISSEVNTYRSGLD